MSDEKRDDEKWDEKWDDQVDLLVLGTGAGGLAAAVTGAQEGLSTLVLEKPRERTCTGRDGPRAGGVDRPRRRRPRADRP